MNLNFELILFYATLVTGLIALFDIIFLRTKRKKKSGKMPIVIEYARSFFPVLLLVFLLRSFLFEPFRIPSGSLEPSLLIGDFILLNKYDYGIRLPLIPKKMIEIGQPKRGDIMVFHWPANPSIYFIKRVIGLPGDHISYINKELLINGQPIPQTFIQKKVVREDENEWEALEKQEDLLGVKHKIYINPDRSARDYRDIFVPEGMYFVMGDNRDNSEDSRYWGFVPDKYVVGKAVLVWMSWDSENTNVRWKRIGSLVH